MYNLNKITTFLVTLFPLVAFLNFFELLSFGESISVRATDIFNLVICFFLFVLMFEKRFNKNALRLLFVVYFFVIFNVTFCYINDFPFDIQKLLRLAVTVFSAPIAYIFIKERESLNRILKNIIVVGVFSGFIAVYTFFTTDGIHRIAAFYGAAGGEGLGRQASYNEMGALTSLSAALCLLFILKNETAGYIYRIGYLFSFFCSFLGLLATGSRSGILSFSAAIFVIIFGSKANFSFKSKNIKKFLIYFCVFLLTFLLVYFYFNYLSNSNRILSSFLVGSNAYYSIMERVDLWSNVISKFFENPLIIFGGGGNLWISRTMNAPTLENFFLDTIFSYGLLGGGFIFYFLAIPVRFVKKSCVTTFELLILKVVLIIAVTVSMTGNVLVDPMYGGITFFVLFSLISVLEFEFKGV